MGRYLLRRAAFSVLLLWLVSVITFLLIYQAPGGPAILLQPEISQEQAEAIKRSLGLDRPLYEQYLTWLGRLARGDLGQSFSYSQPVHRLIAGRAPASLLLSGAALLLAISLALPLGIAAAAHPNSRWDYLSTGLSTAGLCLPVFWLGMMLILLLAVTLRLFPAGGMTTEAGEVRLLDTLWHLALPSLVLCAAPMAQLSRYTRASLLTVLREDYVRTARAKGVAPRVVLSRHVFRNALIPVITVLALLTPRLVTGAVITETVFAWPGMGRLAVEAAFQRDYPVIMGVTLVVSALVVLANFGADLLYGAVDPRVKME
jgi:peptide/nickel transport system permease protein